MTDPNSPDIGKVEVDVVPNPRGFGRALKRDLDPEAEKAGRDLGRSIAAPIGKEVAGSITDGLGDAAKKVRPQAQRLGKQTGRSFADKFGTELTAGVTRTIKGLPPITLDADSSKAEKAAANIRRELLQLTGKQIGVDVSSDEAMARIASLRRQLSMLTRQMEKLKVANPEIDIDVDALAAMVEITNLETALKQLVAEQHTIDVDADTGTAAGQLRELGATADTTTRDRQLKIDADDAAVRSKLATLGISIDKATRDRVVNVDVDLFKAMVSAAGLEGIMEVATRDRTINVDADTFGAVAKLAGMATVAKMATTDRTLNIDADVGQAIAEVLGLAAAEQTAAGGARNLSGSLGMASMAAGPLSAQILAIGLGGIAIAGLLVPALAAAVLLMGALAVAAAVVAAAIAVLALGLIPIIAAFMAVGKAEKEAGKQAGGHATQVRSSASAIAAAHRGIAQAVEQAAWDQEAADRRVIAAHEAVGEALKDVTKAQQELTAARDEARRDEEDLASQIKHNAQDQRQNALDLAEAEAELARIQADPRATDAQKAQAQLNYDRLSLQNDDLQTQAERLAEKQAEEAKKGIEGSDKVVAAKDRIRDAEKNLEKAREAQKLAQRERDRTIEQGAQRVADAQRALTEAQKVQTVAIGGTGTAALDAQSKMGKLTKEAQALVMFLKGLDFGPLLKAAQGFAGPLLAGLKKFIPAMMPTLITFVSDVSTGIGKALEIFFKAFSSPFWKDFFVKLGKFAKDALPGFASGMEKAARGIAGLIEAFMPSSKIVGGGLLAMLTDFAEWAAGLKDNPKFQEFIAYALEQLPKLWELLKQLGAFLVTLGLALAPIGEAVMAGLTKLFAWLAGIDPERLTKIIVAVAGIAAALLAWAGISAIIAGVSAAIGFVITAFGVIAGIVEVVTAAFVTFGIAVAGPVLAIVAAVAALVAGLIWLFFNNKAFHDWVINAWNAISNAFVVAWNVYIKPALMAIWKLIQETVMPVLIALWKDVVVPALKFIAAAFVLAWTIIKPVLMVLWWIIKTIIIPIIVFLWKYVVVPAFKGISLAIQIAFKIISVIFTLLRVLIEGVLIPVFLKIWEKIKWVWEKVKPFFTWLGEVIKKYVIPPFKAGVDALGKAFDKVREFFKKPIEFVVNTVINKGVIKAMNWLSTKLNVKDAHIDDVPWPPAGWAAGGPVRGPGTTTSDSIIGRLSDNEHVWTAAEVMAAGGHKNVLMLRKLALTGMLARLGDGAAFATGGPVHAHPTVVDGMPAFGFGGIVNSGWAALGDAVTWASQGVKGAAGLLGDFTKKALSAIGDPGQIIKKLADKLVNLIPDQDTSFGKIMAGIPRLALDFIKTKIDALRAAFFGGPGAAAPWTGTLSPDPLLKRMQEFALAQRGKKYLFGTAGPNTFDCCIVAGVRIYGPDGSKPIEDVRAGDRVYSYVNGKLQAHTVTAAWQSLHQPVFDVRTRNRTVTASANHPFLRVVESGTEQVQQWEDADWPGLTGRRYRNVGACSVSTCPTAPRDKGMCSKHVARFYKHGDPRVAYTSTRITYDTQWARLDELERGDLLVQPRIMPTEPQDLPTLNDGTPVDDDVAWLIGAAVGDGSVTEATLRLCMFGEDRERAAAIITARWGGKITVGASYGMVSSRVQLARALAALGMRRLGPDKRMPQAVWTWEPRLQRAFLDGYCDADGHRPANQSRHGERIYHSASRELIEDVRALHLALGDPVSNITVTRRTKPIIIKGKEVKNARDLHSFAIWPRSARAAGEARLRQSPGLADWLEGKDFTIAPMLSVKAAGEQDTWDLSIEDAHNFIADGVVVHNSGLVSNLWGIATGNPLNRRYMSTATMGAGRHGMVAGPGRFTIYLNSGKGHTAANIDGLHAEAHGPEGAPMAIGHVGTRLSFYNERLHLPGFASGGPVNIGALGSKEERLLSFLQYGWPEPPVSFDAGGLLFNTTQMPGQVMPVYHGGSKPDAVLTDQQWRDMHGAAQQPARGAGGGVAIENYYEAGSDPAEVARDLDWLSRGLG